MFWSFLTKKFFLNTWRKALIFWNVFFPGTHYNFWGSLWGIGMGDRYGCTPRDLARSRFKTSLIGLLFERLGWKRLESQRQIQEAIMVYKSLNGLVPTYLQSIFTDRSNITQYELRDTVGKLAVPLPRTNYLKNSFSYQGAVLWNSLPPDLRQAQTLNGFRIGCRHHFS